MNPETLMIVFGLLWGGWIIFRIHKRRQSQNDPSSSIVSKPKLKPSEMPRMGNPGSITFNQTRALQRNDFSPDKTWSLEEAALILDALKYLRSVCREIAEDKDGVAPLEVQNALLRYILTQQDIRDYVRKWGEDRRNLGFEDYADDEPNLEKNNQYERVVNEAKLYLSS